jgi:uncharacterized protein (TIGR02001 family)
MWRFVLVLMTLFVCVKPCNGDGSFNGYTLLTNNYVGRGLAQSVGNPSVQTEFEYLDNSGFYADLDFTTINWIDQLFPGDSVSVEVDLIVAYRQAFAEHGLWKAGLLRLEFPGHYVKQNPHVDEPHTTEAFVFVGWKQFSAKINYALTDSFATPDSQGTWYLDLSANTMLDNHWQLLAHLGRKQARGQNPLTGFENRRTSYNDIKLAVAYWFETNYSIELAHSRTNANADYYTLNDYNVAGNFWVLTVKKVF